MCAPSLLATVHSELSRRGFVGMLASAAVGAAVSPAAAQQRPVRLQGGFRQVFDLTHVFSPRLPLHPAFRPVEIRQKFTIENDGFFANEVRFDEHCGTHMDAPRHFVDGMPTVEQIPADRLIAPLVVISITGRAARDADAEVTLDDVTAWEKQHGRIPAGAFVAMHSGWDARIGEPERFLNADAQGTLHAPGFGGEASRFLVEERDIVGIGVDTFSLDPMAAAKPVSHLAVLGANKYGLEVMANLGSVPPAGATIVVGAPKHEGGSGGPLRVLAVR